VIARWVLIAAALPIGYATAGLLNASAALARRRAGAGAADAQPDVETARHEPVAASDLPQPDYKP
jgi:hypothetical protein